MKRFLSLLAVLTVCLAALVISASADVPLGADWDNLTYTLENGTLTISGTGEMNQFLQYHASPWYVQNQSITKVVVEEGVTSIGSYAFYGCQNVTSVELPSTLTSIGDYAFCQCDGLTGLTIPSGVKSMGKSVFYDCDALTDMTIPAGVTAIGDGTFYGCDALTEVTLPDTVTSIGGTAFYDCQKLTSVKLPAGVTAIGDSAFQNCSGLTGITIPSKMESIGSHTFYGCSSLTGITIPSKVTSIGDSAFSGCSNLTSVTVPDTVTSLGTGVFRGCGYLNSVKLPSGLTAIPDHLFQDCSYLRSVKLPAGVTSIGAGAFARSGLTSITLPDGVTSIGANAFSSTDLTTIALPEGLESIGSGAFVDACLTEIVIPDTVTEMGAEMFNGCTSLKTVTLPAGMTEIPENMFYWCWKLNSVNIPDGVTSIGKMAFFMCYSLRSLTLPEGLETIGNQAFQESWSLNTIAIPASVTSIGVAAFDQCDGLTDVYFGGTEEAWNELMANNNGLFPEGATVHFGAMNITDHPDNARAVVGSTAKFTVKASGESLKYQWQYCTAKGTTWSNTTLTGNKTATLSVGATAGRNGYRYRCAITDANGVTLYTNPATLTVVSMSITAQPEDAAEVVGATAKFTVKVEGSGLKYQWQYRTSASGTWKNTTLTGCKTATLSVGATAGRYGYQYRCVITDVNGSKVTSDAAVLTVLPKITQEPEEVLAAKGTDAEFSVTAVGKGLSYRWQYRAPGGSWKNTVLAGNRTDTLTVGATAGRNGYRYRCTVTDVGGEQIISYGAYLIVVVPEIITQPEDIALNEGEYAEFFVEASGVGMSYQWQYCTAKGTKWTNTTLTGNKTDTLTVKATAGRDGYKYRCVITDEGGNRVTSDYGVLTAHGLDIVSQPEDVSAALGGKAVFAVEATGADLSYQWQYCTAAGSTWKNTTLTGNKTDTLTVGVTAGRDGYKYRCVVTDANGDSVTSDYGVLSVE